MVGGQGVTDIGSFIREIGFPIFIALVGAWCLYKIGEVVGRLMIDAWQGKDTRLAALELRVEKINNGQREALERRFDLALKQQEQSTEAMGRVADSLSHQAQALIEFAEKRPCLRDSDIDRLETEADKAVERVTKRKARVDAKSGTDGPVGDAPA
jgi:hypothetical protein